MIGKKQNFLKWLVGQNIRSFNGQKLSLEDIKITSKNNITLKKLRKYNLWPKISCIMEEHEKFVLYVKNVVPC